MPNYNNSTPNPDDDYESEFAAPEHTIVSVEIENGTRIITVIIDGDIEVFTTPLYLYDQATELADPNIRAGEILLRQMLGDE